MLESALSSNVFILSQMLSSRYPTNFLVRLLGPMEDSMRLAAASGISYYMIVDPITAIYIQLAANLTIFVFERSLVPSGSETRTLERLSSCQGS
ncbi:hypothetical protein C8R44DRAFT_881640 [Mycena epipterygia]|nr:hypothetical protein C8R44DRAFT_881640 [Mycena epipterygia]